MRMGTVALLLSVVATTSGAEDLSQFDVVWDSPSKDHTGSMPLGNGDIGLNAWFDQTGDLLFYIGKTDSWGDNARLLKVGRVRVQLEPNPLADTQPFRQTLSLNDATLKVLIGKAPTQTTVHVWVDANHPVIHVAIDSPTATQATACIELWRTAPEQLPSIEVSDVHLDRSKPNSQRFPTIVEPDTVLRNQANRIGWYHHNRKSAGPELAARLQGLTGFSQEDPLLHRTFGAVITADGGQPMDDLHLTSPAGKRHRFSVFVLTCHPSTPDAWLESMQQTIDATQRQEFAARRAAHESWWRDFWQRSWIFAHSSAESQPTTLVPENDLAVRVGYDQHGGNRMVGELGRVSVYGRALSDDEIGGLAAGGREYELPETDDALFSSQVAEPTTVPNSAAWDFSSGLTVEAWLQPDRLPNSGARIVDKITPGGSDGFLLDTWPGNSLRFICDGAIAQTDAGPPAGQWSHVAAVVDPADGQARLYCNGQLVAEAFLGEALDDAYVVTRGYHLQRFINACNGRGSFPIKFNGSIFTVPFDDRPGDADYRRWGPGYWWQNTRLPYISMCASGDTDLMEPLFHMYAGEVLELSKYRTRHYLGCDGTYFPECIYFWGPVFNETYGWTPFDEREDKLQESGWHKWEWTSGIELAWMMLDRYEYTMDVEFLQQTLIPFAHEILTFFDQHFEVDDQGQIVMHPSQALETWWDCTNPMTDVAGLRAVTERLLALPPDRTPAAERELWQRVRNKMPPLPLRDVEGRQALAPAEQYANKRNIENPELYAVFPFRQIAIGRPNLDWGLAALEHRWNRGNSGWRQDDIFMAYLGLADQARANLVARAKRYDANSRFPAFWGPNYDWVPDQDHGSVLLKAFQAMAMQTDGRKIYLLPAWPQDWNAQFKLHAPYQTIVECEYRDGRVQSLQVTPESRRDDIELLLESP